MSFQLRSYEDMKTEFAIEVTALRGKHSAESIDKLPAHRRSQVEVINKAIELLDASKSGNEEKSRYLTGFMYLTMTQIPGSGSLLKKSLVKVMGIHPEDKKNKITENLIDSNDAVSILSATTKFISSHIFESDNKTMKKEHPFCEIKHFDISQFLLAANDLLHCSRTASITDASQKREGKIAEEKRAKEGPGFLEKTLNFLVWTKPKSSKKHEKDEKYEKEDSDDEDMTTTNGMKS